MDTAKHCAAPGALAPISAAPLARAVAKIERRVLPLFVIMFIVNYIDRVNIGFVREHLAADVGIGTAAYGLGAGLFFVGYAIFEVPSNLLLARFGAKAWLTRIMLTWGIAATAMAFVRGETSFYVLRFLLGVAEAGFFPGVIYYFTQWLPAGARGKAMAVFLSGSALASILAGPVSGALLGLGAMAGSGLHGWQWMFVIEGAASILLCAVVWCWLDSRPAEARWLADEERRAIVETIAAEQAAREREQPAHVSPLELLADPRIALYCFIYFAISLTIYGATFWLPGIIRKMGHYSDFQVGLFNSIPWLVSIVAMIGFARLAARHPHQQWWTSVALLIAALGMLVSSFGGGAFAFVSICFAAVGFKAASSLFWPIPQNHLDARIAAGVIALINSIGNLGGFVAPTVFGLLEQHTGSIRGGLAGLSVCSLLAVLAVWFTRERPRRRAEPLSRRAG
ncbi:MFS transporter [Burkholderia gladioli]|uniref:MFS transporter n=1 Tax=Burkholderia gladioli TaxID=28095 RepID=UPI00163E4122|nr:MFS transporter [Burkholderia gladioli]